MADLRQALSTPIFINKIKVPWLTFLHLISLLRRERERERREREREREKERQRETER